MVRVATTNYTASSDTQFQWATSDNDLFDREFDLYRLAQALEAHDHSSTRGVAVTRLGTVTGTPTFSGNVTMSAGLTVGTTLGVTGATTLSNTLAVTGAATLSSTLAITGNLTVNTNKFTVTAASGNTAVAGTLAVTGAATLASTLGVTGAGTFASTLGVTGNFAVNTNKFTVTAASGNTAVAGTLAVTGDVTFTTSLLNCSASYLGIYDGAGAARALKAGSLVTSTNYGQTAPANGIYSLGVVQTAGGITVDGNAAITPAPVSGTPAQHGLYRESVVKAWGYVALAGSLTAGFNVSSVSRTGTGSYTVNLDRDFSGTYAVLINPLVPSGGNARFGHVVTLAVGSFTVRIWDINEVVTDADFSFIAIGPQ